jgi:type I restriction enzyme S subunit
VNKLKNWLPVKISEIIKTQKGKKPIDLGELSEDRNIPYIDIKAFELNIIRQYCTDERVVLCEENDILIVWDGSRSGLVGIGAKGAVGSTIAIISIPLIKPKFLYYFFQSYYIYLNTNTRGIGIPHVDPIHFGNLLLPITSYKQQTAIIERIEELFSHIDAGVEGLKQAKAKLQQYRQSVLKDAVTGKLTETWREQNAEKLEPANELLERILEERRANWEAEQLKSFEEKSKIPKDDKWKSKYKKPILPNESVQTSFPVSWEVVSPDMVFASVTDGDHQAPPKADNGIPFLVIGDVKTGKVNISDKRFVPREYYDAIKYERKPIKGDLLYTVVGSYGIPVKVESDIEFCVQRHIAILKPSSGIDRDFYFHLFKSGLVYSQAGDVATGTAQKTVSLGGLRSFKIPLPPAEEQFAISNLVTEKLEGSFRTEATIDQKIRHSASLKSSILSDAFSGKLVENIETDETAEQLLEKIQAEKLLLDEKAKLAKKKPTTRAKKMDKQPIIDVLKKAAGADKKDKALTVDELFEQAGFQNDVSPEGIEAFYQELKIVTENKNVTVTPVMLKEQKQGDKFEYKEVKENEAG